MDKTGLYMWRKIHEFLLTWKPIHLCWWFIKRGKPIPKYFIGGSSSPPSVTTNAATNVAITTATLNGNVTSDGGDTITARGFVYSSTDATPTIGEGGVTDTGNLGGTTGTYSHGATGLSAGTQYWYQAYATNGKGTSYGGVQTFTTEESPTVVLNSPADAATGVSTTPTLEFTGTDGSGDDIRYNVQVDTDNSFPSGSDEYGSANFSASYSMQSGGITAVSQSFNGVGGRLDTAYMRFVSSVFSASGNVTLEIYAHSGTYGTSSVPTGSALATSDAIDASTFPSGANDITFTFSGANRIALNSGTNYVLVANYSGSNILLAHTDITSPTHSGNAASYNGSWSADSGRDLIFGVFTSILIDAVSGTDSGFANTVTPADTDPFNSGEKADYDVQAGDTLNNSTTYYWRVRGIDPSGSNTYGSWATTRSFTTDSGGTPVTVSPSALALTTSQPADTVTAVKNVTVSPSAQTLTTSQPTPTITAVINKTVAVAALSLALSLPSIGVSVGDGATVSSQNLTITQPTPTITAVQNLTTSPAVQTLTSSQPTPAIQTGNTVSVNALSVTSSQPTPTVEFGKTVTIGSEQTLTTSQPTITVTTTKNVSLTPAAQSLTTSQPADTVTAVQNVSVSPSALVLTASEPTPTVTAGVSITVSPSALSLTSSQPTASVGTGTTTSPTVLSLTTSQPTPTVDASGDKIVSGTVVTATVSQPTPTISTVWNVTVSPSALALTGSQPSTGISVGDGAIVSSQNLSVVLPSPTVSTVQNVSLTPAVQSLTLSEPTITVTPIQNYTFSAPVLSFGTGTTQVPTKLVYMGGKFGVYIGGNIYQKI